MAVIAKLEGLDKVVAGIKRLDRAAAKGFEIGLVRAGLYVQRESQKIVPVDTGALRNSAYTRKKGSGKKTEVSVGYTQSYAIYVHERTELRHRAPTRAKYLSSVLVDHRGVIMRIISKTIEEMARK